jgi:predicted aspartyl protease
MSASRYSYDREHFNPPAPTLKIKVSRPISMFSEEINGKIDTGADKTIIPDTLAEKLGLNPARPVRLRGFRDVAARKTPAFYANISIAGFNLEYMEVASVQRENVLIGRDILNELKILLDGKNLNFEISDP